MSLQNNQDIQNTLNYLRDMIGTLNTRLQSLELENKHNEPENKEVKVQPQDADNVVDENIEYDEEEYIVNKVVNHRVIDGVIEYELEWKDYWGTTWVREDLCSCDELIQEYLRVNNIIIIYIYCRVSTKDQNRDGSLSLEGQEEVLRASVQDKNTLVRVVKECVSASKNVPKGLRKIISNVKKGDSILVWKVDRFGRNTTKSLPLLNELTSKGVTVHAHQENISYNGSRMQFSQAILDAEKESVNIGERVKLAFEQRRKRGDEKLGKLPYGKMYITVRNETGDIVRKKVCVNTIEMDVINYIKSSYNSCKEIAEKLNEDGRLKRGKEWNVGMVRRIMKRI